jgi:hypothetical protein
MVDILQLVSIYVTLYRLCNITEATFLMNLFQLMHLFSIQNRDMSKIPYFKIVYGSANCN